MNSAQQQIWNDPVLGNLWNISDPNGYVQVWRKAIWERLCATFNGRKTTILFGNANSEVNSVVILNNRKPEYRVPDFDKSYDDPYDFMVEYGSMNLSGYGNPISVYDFMVRRFPLEINKFDVDYDPQIFGFYSNTGVGTGFTPQSYQCSQKYYDKQVGKYGSCAIPIALYAVVTFIYLEGVSDPVMKRETGRKYKFDFGTKEYIPIYYAWEAPGVGAYPVYQPKKWITITPSAITYSENGKPINTDQGISGGYSLDLSITNNYVALGFGTPKVGDYALLWWQMMGLIVKDLQTNFPRVGRKSTNADILDGSSLDDAVINDDWVIQNHNNNFRHRWVREIINDDVVSGDSASKPTLAWQNPQIGWRAKSQGDITFAQGGLSTQFRKRRIAVNYEYKQGPFRRRYFAWNTSQFVVQKWWEPTTAEPDVIEDFNGCPLFGGIATTKQDQPVRGDYFGPWILEDIRTALKRMKFTIEIPDAIGTSTVKMAFPNPKQGQVGQDPAYDIVTLQFSYDTRRYNTDNFKTDLANFLLSSQFTMTGNQSIPTGDIVPGGQWFGNVATTVAGLDSRMPDRFPSELWLGSTGEFVLGRQDFVPINGTPHIYARFMYNVGPNASNPNGVGKYPLYALGREFGRIKTRISPTQLQTISYYEKANERTFDFSIFSDFPTVTNDGLFITGTPGGVTPIPHVNSTLFDKSFYYFGTLALIEWDFEFA